MTKPIPILIAMTFGVISNFFYIQKALSQPVGIKQCDFNGRDYNTPIKRKIFSAKLDLAPKGYKLAIIEEDDRQTFGLTQNLNYYYTSFGFIIEDIRPALISPDGSFLLVLPYTPRTGCTFQGKLVFGKGVKERLFGSIAANNATQSSCEGALAYTKNKLLGANAVVVNVDKRNHNYTDPPENRHLAYGVWLTGAGVTNILNSPVLLRNLTAKMVKSCRSVGMVRFGLYKSDYGVTLGILSNGMIAQFKCIDAGLLLGKKLQSLPWGTEACV